jgi:hypothetical protein
MVAKDEGVYMVGYRCGVRCCCSVWAQGRAIYVYVYVHVHVHVHAYAYVYVYVCVCICTCICICMYMHVYVRLRRPGKPRTPHLPRGRPEAPRGCCWSSAQARLLS